MMLEGDPQRSNERIGLLQAMWRQRRLVVAVTVVAALAGYGLSLLASKQYTAEADLILSDPRNAGVFRETTQLVVDPNRYARNQAERMLSLTVLSRAAELEGNRLAVDEIRLQVDVSAAPNLDLLTISATDATPEGAASLANSVGEAYELVVVEDTAAAAAAAVTELDRVQAELESTIADLNTTLDADPGNSAARAERDAALARVANIRDRAEQLAVDAALYGSGVQVFDPAEVPQSPTSPQPMRNAALAAFFALAAAGAYAWWRAQHARRAVDRHDPALVLQAPLLGEIADFAALGIDLVDAHVFPKGTPVAEAYQFVFSSVEYALDGAGSTVVVTSSDEGDGKTVSTVNLGVAAAQAGRSVLLVDADERMRGLTSHVGAEQGPGLTDLVDGKVSFEDATRTLELGDGHTLDLLPGGGPLGEPAGFFSTSTFRALMADLRKRADVVLIDTPPILAVADASAIAAQADGIVLVVNKGVPLQHLADVRDRLRFVGTPLLGYVFNRSDSNVRRYRYGYGHGSAHRSGPSKPVSIVVGPHNGNGGKQVGDRLAVSSQPAPRTQQG